MKKNAAELLVECLEAEEVEYVFGVPGEENLDMLEALRDSPIRFVVTRHEQAAAFMAATFGRLTGKAGVVLSTLGPGATNAITGVAFAQLGGMPLVLVTGQKPVRKSKQGKFQIIDVTDMMRPVTKMAETIASADRIPSLVREAFKRAEEERPGAVHLEFPEDVAKEGSSLSPLPRIKVRRPGPDPKAVDQAVSLINGSRHPLILVAAGANRKLVRKHLAAFIEKTGIPFVTTQMGKGVISEENDRYIGTTALSGGEPAHCAIDHADTVIVAGHDVGEKPPAMMGHGKRTIIHINFYSAQVDDVYFPSHEVVGDISHTFWALSEKVVPRREWDFSYFEKLIGRRKEFLEEGSKDDGFPMRPRRIIADLRNVLPRDGILSLDNGMYKLWFARYYPAYEQNSVLLDNALATMGAGLPGAIAAKLVRPDSKVIAIVGDGGFMMNSQELETAVRLELDLVVVILRDNEYGMIAWKQRSMDLPSFGLGFGNPDFVKYAESYGAKGYRIGRADEFAPLMNRIIGEKGVHVVDCPIDYTENEVVFSGKTDGEECI